jgi:hypothetical protein
MRINSFRVAFLGVAFALSGVFVILASTGTARASAAPQTKPQGGSHDFDFLFGRWNVHNRELVKRLAGSHQWVEFEATDAFHSLPGGMGTEENYSTEHWSHYAAVGLHLFNPDNGRWTLYWADNRNSLGTMQMLASGKFSRGIGTFYAPDKFNGKPILVRITWTHQSRKHAHWEQAFSTDHGKTWETNWIMDFTRT